MDRNVGFGNISQQQIVSAETVRWQPTHRVDSGQISARRNEDELSPICCDINQPSATKVKCEANNVHEINRWLYSLVDNFQGKQYFDKFTSFVYFYNYVVIPYINYLVIQKYSRRAI